MASTDEPAAQLHPSDPANRIAEYISDLPGDQRLGLLLWLSRETGVGIVRLRPDYPRSRWDYDDEGPYPEDYVLTPYADVSEFMAHNVATEPLHRLASDSATRMAARTFGSDPDRRAQMTAAELDVEADAAFRLWRNFGLAPLIGDAPQWYQNAAAEYIEPRFRKFFTGERPPDTSYYYGAGIDVAAHRATLYEVWRQLGGATALKELQARYPDQGPDVRSHGELFESPGDVHGIAGSFRPEPIAEGLKADAKEYEVLGFAAQQLAAVGVLLKSMDFEVKVGRFIYYGTENGLVRSNGSDEQSLSLAASTQGPAPSADDMTKAYYDLKLQGFARISKGLDAHRDRLVANTERLKTYLVEQGPVFSGVSLEAAESWSRPDPGLETIASPAHHLLRRAGTQKQWEQDLGEAIDNVVSTMLREASVEKVDAGKRTYGRDYYGHAVVLERKHFWSPLKRQEVSVAKRASEVLDDLPALTRLLVSEPEQRRREAQFESESRAAARTAEIEAGEDAATLIIDAAASVTSPMPSDPAKFRGRRQELPDRSSTDKTWGL